MLTLRKGTMHFILLSTIINLYNVAFADDSKINIQEQEKEVLDQLLANGKYDARTRPPGLNNTNAPVIIYFELNVRSTPNIDETKQEHTVHLTLNEKWVDKRLKFDDMGGELKYLTLTSTERIWLPELSIINEKESHSYNILTPTTNLRIFPNGDVLYSTRVSMTLDCPMDFELYPFDYQRCFLLMDSRELYTGNVVFIWRESNPLKVRNRDNLREFSLVRYEAEYCPYPEYPCLKATFSFKRHLMPSLIRIYIPTFVLVLTSWISFWLDPNSVTARILLGVTTLFAMILQISIGTTTQPAVSYIKAVDIWMGVCLMFIFGALLEFVTLNYVSRCEFQNKCDQSDKKPRMTTKLTHLHAWLLKLTRPKTIDVVSRIMFPASFAIFNSVYWMKYLTLEEF